MSQVLSLLQNMWSILPMAGGQGRAPGSGSIPDASALLIMSIAPIYF